MISLLKILANQANSKKSTGPKTAAGKARTANNAIRHGLYSKRTIVLSVEDSTQLAAIREDYIRQFRPTTSAELIHVETMVNSDWRLRRVWELEPASIDHVLEVQAAELESLVPGIDNATRTAFAYAELAGETRLLDSYQRLETNLQHRWDRAHRSLIRLRDPKFVHEPILDSEPPAADPLTDLAALCSAVDSIPHDLEDHSEAPVDSTPDPETEEITESDPENTAEIENCRNKATEFLRPPTSPAPIAPQPAENLSEPAPSHPFGSLEGVK